jgi:hypothetical protein
MADEPHDAVKLLIARMESHPEEFRFKEGAYHDRWYNHISAINSYGNDADKAAIAAKTRDIRMAEVHEQIMEELCNGPENRRKEEEEVEYGRNLAKSLEHVEKQRQQMTTMQSQHNAYADKLSAYNQAQAVGIAGTYTPSLLQRGRTLLGK